MCKEVKDLTGEKCFNLTALKLIKKKNDKGRLSYVYLCSCQCGNFKLIKENYFRNKKIKSCGCLNKKTSLDRKTVMLNNLYYQTVKKRNKKLGFSECINREEFEKIIFQPCHYCGEEYSKIIKDIRYKNGEKILVSNEEIKCNGIDRIDSNIGYIKENVYPCCSICNRGKLTMTESEFKIWIDNLYNFTTENLQLNEQSN